MKILYGVQGTGNGHISRARMVAKYLSESDAEVTFLFSGRNPDAFFDMECFGKPLYRRGLTFVTHSGKINYLKTLTQNNIFNFLSEIKNLNVDQYDLIITDFEPVTAWAGKLKGKPVIGLGHQYAFNYAIPVAGKNLLASAIMRYFAPAQTAIGLHWHHFGHNILPPIIDNSLHSQAGEGSILVYLPFEDQHEVTRILKTLDGYQFKQYAPELKNAEQGNVSLRKTCHDGFKQDMASASAVICNAGFELVSECLNLQLPILVKPVQGQFEQLSNAHALQQLGYASAIEHLQAEPIEQWLKKDKPVPAIAFNNVAKAIVDWILSHQHTDLEQLTQHLWTPLSPSAK